MDDIVRQALVKWPNVPHCYGWLGLDARGNWYMRDDQAQAAGPFAGEARASRGSLLQHEGLIAFIVRNYDVDEGGQWFFQNGPQRVYVELQATPWIWRVSDDFSVATHGGQAAQVRQVLQDEAGHVYFETDKGFGLVHSQDVHRVATALEQGRWPLIDVLQAALPQRYGYVLSPQARQAAVTA